MKYQLALHRPNEQNSHVQLRTTINGRRVKLSTKVTVPTAKWDNANQRIKTGTSEDLIAKQSELDNAVKAIVNLHNQLVVMDGLELTVDSLRDGVKRMREGKQGVAEKVLTFNQWVDEFIKETERGERTNQKGFAINRATVQKYRTVQKGATTQCLAENELSELTKDQTIPQ